MISAVTQNEQLDFLGHNMHIMSLIIRKLDRNACQQIGVRNMFHQENVGNLAIASSWKGWAGPLIITKQSQNPDRVLESGKPLFCNGSTSRKRNWSVFYTTGGKIDFCRLFPTECRKSLHFYWFRYGCVCFPSLLYSKFDKLSCL